MNERYKFFDTPFACYETRYVDLHVKYTQQKQGGPKNL